MCLPNFLIAGTQKSGSSWLLENLRRHPDIFMPDHELHFFNLEANYCRGLTWYERHSADVGGASAIGEKTPNYLWVTEEKISTRFGDHLPAIPQRIHAVLPEVKLIVIVRNPVERLISAVNHYRRMGQLSPLRPIDQLLMGHHAREAEKYGVFAMGRYDDHISAFQRYFPRSRFLVLIFEEDVLKYPARTLRRVCEYLDVDPDFRFPSADRSVNAFKDVRIGKALFNAFNPWPRSRLMTQFRRLLQGPWAGPRFTKARPSPPVIEQLYEMYAEPNERLFQRLGRRPPSWAYDSRSSDRAA